MKDMTAQEIRAWVGGRTYTSEMEMNELPLYTFLTWIGKNIKSEGTTDYSYRKIARMDDETLVKIYLQSLLDPSSRGQNDA